MKIGLKLDDTPSLGHLAGQEVPHHLLKGSVSNFLNFLLTLDIFGLNRGLRCHKFNALSFEGRNGLQMAFFKGIWLGDFHKVA